jgi:hypothetical protein
LEHVGTNINAAVGKVLVEDVATLRVHALGLFEALHCAEDSIDERQVWAVVFKIASMLGRRQGTFRKVFLETCRLSLDAK